MKKPLNKQLVAQFYRGNRLIYLLAVFASLTTGSLNLILSWILQELIDAASGAADAMPMGELINIVIAFLLLTVFLLFLEYLSEPRFIARAIRRYKEFAFEKLTEKSVSSFRDESTAAYLSALTNDAGTIEADYLSQQFSTITKAITFFGALAMMLWYSPLLTLIALSLTALPLAASLLTGNRLRRVEKRVSDRNRDFTAALTDCLGGFDVVKTFRAEKEIFRLFAEQNRALENEKFTRRRLKALIGMIGSVTGMVAQLGVFLAGTWLALSGYGLSAGAVILFVNLMNFMIEPIAELPALLAGRRAALLLIDKLADALTKNAAGEGEKRIGGVSKAIRMENISFGYEEGKDVLQGLSATFEAGKSYAIVGGSGSGKSTLLHLLMAGSANYRGNIRMDDTELREIAPESLYETMSVISQNVFVFNASIKDNISMFRTFDQQKLNEAIQHAHLNKLISERGEDYCCGENGCGLSGGEKQRISIARSLLKKSSVLLADEVTAALDAQTAHQVSSDILDLDGITRIVVTHTLEESLLRRYDRILVLKNGRIAETGDFDDLMEKKGYFYALYTVSQ